MKKIITTVLFAIIASSVSAECKDLYPPNVEIVVKNTVELCNTFYVALYDEQHNAVIATIERLRKEAKVGSETRINTFRPDRRVPPVKVSDYNRSGFDKGHMAPAANASTYQEMMETFLLSNMTPQRPLLNREDWKRLETSIRNIWKSSNGDVFVLTVAVYNKPELMANRIPIPVGYWKLIYVDGKTFAHYAENRNLAKVKKVDINTVNLNDILTPVWR
jgi:endonuclease G